MKPFDARVMVVCLVFFSLAIATIHFPWLIVAMAACAYPWESKTEHSVGDTNHGSFIYLIPVICMSVAAMGCFVRGFLQAYWLTDGSINLLQVNLPLSIEKLLFVPISVITLRVLLAALMCGIGFWMDGIRRTNCPTL